jgi:hypothetical protein
LRLAAVTEMVLLFIVGFILLDREAILFAVIVAVTSAWIFLRHGSRIAVTIRGLVFLDVEFFMVTAAVSNIGHHEAIGPVLAPLALSVTSAVGIIACGRDRGSRGRGLHRRAWVLERGGAWPSPGRQTWRRCDQRHQRQVLDTEPARPRERGHRLHDQQ